MAYTCKDSCDSSSADSCEDFESTSGSSSSEESAIYEPDSILFTVLFNQKHFYSYVMLAVIGANESCE